jgi:hypothetical protein
VKRASDTGVLTDWRASRHTPAEDGAGVSPIRLPNLLVLRGGQHARARHISETLTGLWAAKPAQTGTAQSPGSRPPFPAGHPPDVRVFLGSAGAPFPGAINFPRNIPVPPSVSSPPLARQPGGRRSPNAQLMLRDSGANRCDVPFTFPERRLAWVAHRYAAPAWLPRIPACAVLRRAATPFQA